MVLISFDTNFNSISKVALVNRKKIKHAQSHWDF